MSRKLLEQHSKMAHSGSFDSYEKKIKNLEPNVSAEQIKDTMAAHFDKACDLCSTELESFSFAKNHYLTVHKVRTGYLKCCNVKLKDEKQVLDHISWHFDATIFMCPKCQTDLKTRANLLRHIGKHRALETKQFNCEECNKTFTGSFRFKTHMERFHSERRRPATSLQSAESRAEPFQQQMLATSEIDEQNVDIEIPDYFDMRCDLCAVMFRSFDEAREHFLEAHSIERGYVKCCDMKFQSKPSIKDHIAWHKNPHIFRCHECNKSFPNRKNLLKHNEKHKQPFVCNICDKVYLGKKSLERHLSTHGKRERDMICGVCNKGFYKGANLRAHERTHKLDKTHICEFCGKGFRAQPNLNDHLKIHDLTRNKRKFQCNLCHGWFMTKNSLRAHMITHTSGPQKCDQCDKVAPNITALHSHIRKVHCESNFKCHLCEKTFKLPAALKDHIATHMGEKNYKCTFCDEAFIWRTNMYKHRKNVHKEQWMAEKAKLNADTMEA